MNLKPGSIVKWNVPKGLCVVLKIDGDDIVFLLPDGMLLELRELRHLVDEEFTVL